MASEVVKYAPQSVIDELDRLADAYQYVFDIFAEESVLSSSHNHVNSWMYDRNEIDETTVGRELAVINHLFGIERLQPEREPRYYAVVPYDSANEKVYVRNSDGTLCDLIYISMTYSIDYEQGISRELAENIAKEFGGKTKEIK